jgi:transmembrane sensor
MSLSPAPTDQAREQAADWFARLKQRDISAADMEAFRIWRKAPGHKEAYDEADAFWRRSEALKADADIQDALTAALGRADKAPEHRSARPIYRPIVGLGLAAAVVALVAGGAFVVHGSQSYTTDVGEQRLVSLADGSTVRLDTNSKVEVRFKAGRRDVRLVRGQALFQVAHDAARPFVVKADGASVTALGTRFDVKHEAGGVRVTLVQGSVEVRAQHGAAPQVWRLQPGQAVSTSQPAATPKPVDVDVATSWTQGRLVFHALPLTQAVAEVNRYSHERIELDPGPVAGQPITAAFNVGDTEAFVAAVAEVHDLKVTRPEEGVIRLSEARTKDAYP